MVSQPCIVFARSRVSLAPGLDEYDQLTEPLPPFTSTVGLVGADTIVAPQWSDDGEGLIAESRADWMEYFEIAAVGPNITAATYEEVEITDGDFAGIDPSLLPDIYSQPRPSSDIEYHLSRPGAVVKPDFGRRMLMVNFEHDLDARQLERTRERVQRRLGICIQVWSGRTFSAYCFVDSRKPDLIVGELSNFLDCDEIQDYLSVELTEMIVPDQSGLSRLDSWMSTGWREMAPRISVRGPRSAGHSKRSSEFARS